ncbi:MAG TPA: hypothetical protein VGS19_19410 [Streptosporangiaceae bacterium]|nr:hypothetical protein [Streptosporangiaceae bacterium]
MEFEDDPRFDWKLQEVHRKEPASQQREKLLREPPSRDPLQ